MLAMSRPDERHDATAEFCAVMSVITRIEGLTIHCPQIILDDSDNDQRNDKQ